MGPISAACDGCQGPATPLCAKERQGGGHRGPPSNGSSLLWAYPVHEGQGTSLASWSSEIARMQKQ
jgi:hypothetical protein